MQKCTFLRFILSDLGKTLMFIVVAFCVIVVTLSVAGIKFVTPTEEKLADEIVQIETGVDVEQVEECLEKGCKKK